MHTDASGEGLGAILYQTQDDGTDKVIAYASHSFKKSEWKYHSSKLEFLALKWAITNQFHKYLCGGTFKVHSDNNPLTYILTTAKLDTTGQKWVTSLANYNFTITYCSGQHNIDADALSRVPWNMASTDQPLLIKSAPMRGTQGESSIPMIPPDLRVLSKIMQAQEKLQLTPYEWKQGQADDPDIGPIVELLKAKQLQQYKAKEDNPSGMSVLLKYQQDLCLKNGLVYQKVQLKNHQLSMQQFVLPEPFHKQVILACQNDFGHLGMKKTLGLLKDRFCGPKCPKMLDCTYVLVKGALNSNNPKNERR